MAKFHPDIAQLLYPIRKLLGKQSSGVWDEKCTENLNKIIAIVDKAVPLKLPAPGDMFYMYINI